MVKSRTEVAELVNLRWLETSGVDHSANKEEGWAVMKAANVGQAELDKMIEAEAAIVAGQEELAKILERADTFLVDASDEVSAAVKTLVTHLETEGLSTHETEGGDDGDVKTGVNVARIALKIAKRILGKGSNAEEANMQDVLKRLGEAWPDFCQKVAGIVRGDEEEEAKKEAVDKAVEDLQTKVLQPEDK